MAKKNEKPQVINNIKELNLEIDYDKLAEAIVKAQKKAEETTVEEKTPKKKVKFFKTIFAIIFNRNKTNGEFLPGAMSGLIWYIFIAFAVIFASASLTAICSTAHIVCNWINGTIPFNGGSVLVAILLLLFAACSATLALLMRAIANDIENERDKHYLLSIISAITGFFAMIIALIALFKGVG